MEWWGVAPSSLLKGISSKKTNFCENFLFCAKKAQSYKVDSKNSGKNEGLLRSGGDGFWPFKHTLNHIWKKKNDFTHCGNVC